MILIDSDASHAKGLHHLIYSSIIKLNHQTFPYVCIYNVQFGILVGTV